MKTIENWLTPEQRGEVCELLIKHNLLIQSEIVLAGGDTTDIYFDIRSARGSPDAMTELARYFAEPLRRLRPKRFVEVPQAISCLAPLISILTHIPYITIREESKPFRFSHPDIIGPFNQGESVCVVDDVITDGKSKLRPYEICMENGLNPIALVVLVDRQNGWQEFFPEHDINVPVWAGMTLDDVRAYLAHSGKLI